MSTVRPNTALVVIDVQNGVVARARERDRVVGNIQSLVAQARAAQRPVIWVQHVDDELVPGTSPWELVAELVPRQDEAIVTKRYRDAFEGTDLEGVLSARGVGRLVIAGAQTDFCIRSTLHGALARGYDALLVSDAHTTDEPNGPGLPSAAQVIAHTNAYWANQRASACLGSTVETAKVRFGREG
jgi:nicotinamidase-related amidase